MLRRCFAILASLAIAAQAHAEGWTYVGSTTDGKRFDIDLQSVIHYRSGRASALIDGAGTFARWQFDCRGHAYMEGYDSV